MASSQPEDTSRPHRLALVIHALSGGGAERVLTHMANHWSRHGQQVTLVTLAAAETDVYQVSDSVERVGLDVMGQSHGPLSAIKNNFRRARALRLALLAAQPDFVISFTDQMNVLTLLATLGLRLRVIICDRVDPRHHPLGRAWSLLRQTLYRRCFAAVVQTVAIRDVVQPLVAGRPVYVIPNAVAPEVRPDTPQANQAAEDRATSPRRLVAMGRLVPQKGFDLLIAAFAQLATRHTEWRLDVFGEGPQRDALQQQIRQLDLAGRIHLPGWTDDPASEFARADLFVLSSRYEGFPNVVLDAMACGIPVVSFDCPTGPAEIIRHQIDGLLVEPQDVDALAGALDELMASDRTRQEYAGRAAEVTNRFSEATFHARWDGVFRRAAPDGPPFSADCRGGQA